MRALALTTVALLALSGSAPASAQSFLDGLARRAADRLAEAAASRVEETVTGAMTGAAAGPDQPETASGAPAPSTSAPARPARRAEPAAIPSGPAPWPTNAGQVTYTGDLEFAPVYQQELDALEAFSAVRCTGCEGGYFYDHWFTSRFAREQGGVGGVVSRLAIGESISWRGEESNGRIEVTGDAPVGEFPCRQVLYIQTKGDQEARAHGLFCEGRSHSFAATMWDQVL